MSTYADLERAVEQGKTITVRPYAHTEVIIKSSDYETVKSIVDALQPVENTDIPTSAIDTALMHTLFIMDAAFDEDPERVKEHLRKASAYFIDGDVRAYD